MNPHVNYALGVIRRQCWFNDYNTFTTLVGDVDRGRGCYGGMWELSTLYSSLLWPWSYSKKMKSKNKRKKKKKEDSVQEKALLRQGDQTAGTLTWDTEAESDHRQHIAQYLKDQYADGDGGHPQSWGSESGFRAFKKQALLLLFVQSRVTACGQRLPLEFLSDDKSFPSDLSSMTRSVNS